MGQTAPAQSSIRRSFWHSYTITDFNKPCPGCGYSLVGHDAAATKCPECGRELSVEDLVAEYRFLPIWMSVRDVCALPGVAAAVMLLGGLVALLVDDSVAGVVTFIAGACWLLSGGVMALYLLGEGLRVRELRRGMQRTEHLARVGFAAAGLLLMMVVPLVGIVCILWIAEVLR